MAGLDLDRIELAEVFDGAGTITQSMGTIVEIHLGCSNRQVQDSTHHPSFGPDQSTATDGSVRGDPHSTRELKCKLSIVAMGNCVGTRRQALKLINGRELKLKRELKQMLTRSGCLHCKRREKAWTCPDLGSCSCPPNALALPSCVFYSSRIQGLFEGERTELETTQEHWTQVGFGDDVELERVGEENRKYFDEVLVKHPGWSGFFARFEGLIVDEKIGEGGQAEIFGARMKYGEFRGASLVAKVFKMDTPLRDLERQWPIALLSSNQNSYSDWHPFKEVLGGAFIRDEIHKNRFAFVMRRRMCDLRALIDKHMLNLLHMKTHGPPFQDMGNVTMLLHKISFNMCKLHEHGVVHRDIKASNVLLSVYGRMTLQYLMDFECALGAMGTGFWRAPEILEQVQRRVPYHEVVFTEKADIYSFGMLCYEVLTGCIPFDGHPQNDYNIVRGGGRPELPHNLDPVLRELVLDCWNQDPQDRPTAKHIKMTLSMMLYRKDPLDWSH